MIELPRSTLYYRSVANPPSLADAQLVELIQTIQDELAGYGYRRVTHELRRRGHVINHKRVARLMKVCGLGIQPRRQFVRTTDSCHDSPNFPNLYRNVIPSRPNVVWVADFTYIRIETGFCYLAAIPGIRVDPAPGLRRRGPVQVLVRPYTVVRQSPINPGEAHGQALDS